MVKFTYWETIGSVLLAISIFIAFLIFKQIKKQFVPCDCLELNYKVGQIFKGQLGTYKILSIRGRDYLIQVDSDCKMYMDKIVFNILVQEGELNEVV